uniref:Tyrosine-protein phosphatase domain-containing protein n=4 Tax=Parascaris univalens TaxID=6257 RepID=A0A915B862_PARUN
MSRNQKEPHLQDVTTNNKKAIIQQKASNTGVKRHSARGAVYYDRAIDDSSISVHTLTTDSLRSSELPPTPASVSKKSKGESGNTAIAERKTVIPGEKTHPKPMRPIYYDPKYDDVSKSLERISSTTVSEDPSSILTPIPEKALSKRPRRREIKSTRTAQDVTTESEATGSETTSEDNSRLDGVLHSPRHKSNRDNMRKAETVSSRTSSVESTRSPPANRPTASGAQMSSSMDLLSAPKAHEAIAASKSATKSKQQCNVEIDGQQRSVTCEDLVNFLRRMLNKVSAENMLKEEHKALLRRQRHISEFCKNLSVNGKNRYSHMVNFNEHAVRLKPTAPGDGKYIHASQIHHTYGNFILAQGPTRNSVVDFYRLIWSNRVKLIVCVDPLVDARNCVHYFEFNQGKTVKVARRFTVLTCKIMKTETPNLTLYELYMANKELRSGATGRKILLLHFSAWEVLRPPTARILLEIVRCMRTLETPSRGSLHPDPILVHGSCGVRRSGIVAVTSMLCNQISLTQKLSIVWTAIEIRRVRYGVLRNRLSFIIVLEAVFLYATSIGALDPHGKIHDVLPIIRRERCRLEGESRRNLHNAFA